MVMMLFMGLYTIVDTVFIARFVNTNALSSVNIVCPVINLIVGVAAITVIIYSQFLLTSLYIGFSMGVAPVISCSYGGENTKQLKKLVRIGFAFIITVSIFVFFFCKRNYCTDICRNESECI